MFVYISKQQTTAIQLTRNDAAGVYLDEVKTSTVDEAYTMVNDIPTGGVINFGVEGEENPNLLCRI